MIGIDRYKEQIKLLEQLRNWESLNLPIVSTNAGYQLMFYLLKTYAINQEEIKLKNIYYSLPFSEKTLRLLLRSLESGSWIDMSKKKTDARFRDVQIRNKLSLVFNLWIKKIESTFS